MFLVNSVGLDSVLLRHQALLLHFQISDDILKVTNAFVEEVARIVLMGDLLLELVQVFCQFIPF